MAALDLRPLSLGELLDRTFFLYRRHFLLFLGIAAIPYLLVLVAIVAPRGFVLLYELPFAAALRAQPPVQLPGACRDRGAVEFSWLLWGLQFSSRFFIRPALPSSPSPRFTAAAKPSIRGSFRLVRGKAGTIFGIMLLSGLIVIAGFIALIIPGLYLMCRIPVATAAAMIEGHRPWRRHSAKLSISPRDFAGRSALIYPARRVQ